MVNPISFDWFAYFGKTTTITPQSFQRVCSSKWYLLPLFEYSCSRRNNNFSDFGLTMRRLTRENHIGVRVVKNISSGVSSFSCEKTKVCGKKKILNKLVVIKDCECVLLIY